MDKEICLSKSQMEFLDSKEAFTLYCGGIGSGKTHAGAFWAITMILKYPGVKGLITANSYSQLKKATLQGLFKLLDELQIPYQYKQQDSEIHIANTIVYVMSMEKYDLLRGVEVGWVWSDEVAFNRKEAFEVLIGRIRGKGPLQWKGTTTPNGFNWLYKRFVENPGSSSKVIHSTTIQNARNLGVNYIKQLKENYDDRLAQQELDGKFINLSSGRVYYNFDREKHVKKFDIFGRFIDMGLDFNVHPLCGIYAYEKAGEIYVTDELYQENSNTFKAAAEIKRKYKFKVDKIICDETGNRRKSSSTNTDHEILRRSGFNLPAFKNPREKDRYNNINRLFYYNRIHIDPKCKKLISDLEQLVYDNKDPLLSHISDALGYLAWYYNPLRRPRRKGSIKYY